MNRKEREKENHEALDVFVDGISVLVAKMENGSEGCHLTGKIYPDYLTVVY